MDAIEARATDGDSRKIPMAAFDGLQGSLSGRLLFPGCPSYEESRSIWNGMIDRRPAAIAQCRGAADIQAAVRFAAEHELSICMKGGGHNIAGLAVSDGALMLDMSPMRGVFVDPEARIANAQAGCLLGDVDRETQLYGMAAVLGFVSQTGIAGLTLGGGFGYLTRQYGWTCDNVRSMRVVTATGEIVKASEQENPDLFWGLRGGGGNFGVLTNIEYELYPVGPEVLAGALFWPAEDASAVLETYRGIVREAPRGLTCAAVLRHAPPSPAISAEHHGKPIIAVFVCDSSPAGVGEEWIAPLRATGGLIGDVVQMRPYLSQQCMLDATQPKGRRYYWKSEYLPGIDSGLEEKVLQHAAGIVSPHSAVILFPVDGALNELPAEHSPMGNRDAGAVLNVTASWDAPVDDERNIAWAREAWSDMREYSTGGTYVNFLTEEEGEDRLQAAYGRNYARLAEVKKTWDPGNFFRTNKNIPPA